MVIVEVYVPSLDKSYDFKLNEDVPVPIIIDELSSIICHKEHCDITGDKNNFMLFKKENGQVLSMKLSLFENGVITGDSLIFV